jgi:hypothetical protein
MTGESIGPMSTPLLLELTKLRSERDEARKYAVIMRDLVVKIGDELGRLAGEVPAGFENFYNPFYWKEEE